MAHSESFFAWRAGVSLSTQRDVAEELGIAIGWRNRYLDAARNSTSDEARHRNVALAKGAQERAIYLRGLTL